MVLCYLCPLFTRASDALKVALPRESSTPKPILRNTSSARSQHCNAYSYLPTTAEAGLLTQHISVRPPTYRDLCLFRLAVSCIGQVPLATADGGTNPLIFIYSGMTPAPSDWIFFCISPSFQYSTPTTSAYVPHALCIKLCTNSLMIAVGNGQDPVPPPLALL